MPTVTPFLVYAPESISKIEQDEYNAMRDKIVQDVKDERKYYISFTDKTMGGLSGLKPYNSRIDHSQIHAICKQLGYGMGQTNIFHISQAKIEALMQFIAAP